MELVQLFNYAKLIVVAIAIVLAFMYGIYFLVAKPWKQKVVFPWEKEERRAQRKKEKAELRARKEFWK